MRAPTLRSVGARKVVISAVLQVAHDNTHGLGLPTQWDEVRTRARASYIAARHRIAKASSHEQLNEALINTLDLFGQSFDPRGHESASTWAWQALWADMLMAEDIEGGVVSRATGRVMSPQNQYGWGNNCEYAKKTKGCKNLQGERSKVLAMPAIDAAKYVMAYLPEKRWLGENSINVADYMGSAVHTWGQLASAIVEVALAVIGAAAGAPAAAAVSKAVAAAETVLASGADYESYATKAGYHGLANAAAYLTPHL